MAKAKGAAKPKETEGDGDTYVDERTGEIRTRRQETADTPLLPGFGGEGFDPTGITTKKKVIVPVLSWANGATIYFKCAGPIYLGKELKAGTGKPKRAPAHLMLIEGLDGTQRLLIVGAVLMGTLQESYPDEEYVGLWFKALKIPPNEAKGQDYNTYELDEILDPTKRKS